MRFTVPFAFTLALLGCAPDHTSFVAPPPCSGTNCTPGVKGGGNGAGGSGAGGGGTGGAVQADLIGTVDKLQNPDFTDPNATLSAQLTITTYATNGATVTGSYVGPTPFDLKNVPTGPTWLLVNDSTNTANLWPTFSYVDLPVVSSQPYPVVATDLLTGITKLLPSLTATGASSTGAHVVLLLIDKNTYNPLKGMLVTGGQAGARVVYDVGPGAYDESATSTGAGGTAILFNSGLNGLVGIQLNDTTNLNPHTVQVRAQQGAVTVARVAL